MNTAQSSQVIYPDSDGKPMCENTQQGRWILSLYGNLLALFASREDVFVAADNFWYAVEGDPHARQAPDVYVVFGRPKGDRGSYMQWREEGIPLTVVFEILSPSNTRQEMDDKRAFYEEHGASEYYVYNPARNTLQIYVRRGGVFRRVRPVNGHVSEALGLRFEMTSPEMTVYLPDGRPLLTLQELDQLRIQLQGQLEDAGRQLEDAGRQLEDYSARVQDLESQLQLERRRAQRLRELSRQARSGLATPAELAELERLEAESP